MNLPPQTNGCHMDVPTKNPTIPMANVPRLDPKVQVHKMVVETLARFDNLQQFGSKNKTHNWSLSLRRIHKQILCRNLSLGARD
jgi:hypothetical protein